MKDLRFPSLAASLALHGLLVLLLLVDWGMSTRIPWGQDRRGDPTVVELIKVPAVAAAAAPAPPSTREEGPRAKLKTAPRPRAQTASAAGFGLRDGKASQGVLGRGDGVEASEKERYLYELRLLIEGRKIYPQVSKRFGETGRVTVSFQIRKDGAVGEVRIKSASPFARLNEAAAKLVAELERVQPLPDSVSGDELLVEVPIEYVLKQ